MQEKKQAKKVAGNLEETHGSTLIDTQLWVVAIQLITKENKGQEKLWAVVSHC